MYGFDKQIAKVDLPAAGVAGATVTVFGAERLARDVCWDWQPLLTMAGPMAPKPAVALRTTWQTAQQISRSIIQSATGAPRRLLEANTLPYSTLLTRRLPVLCLKQFRDVGASGGAAYQAITLAQFQLTSFRSALPLPPHGMVLRPLPSTPIAASLGLRDTTVTGPGMFVSLDMTLDPGRVLWRIV